MATDASCSIKSMLRQMFRKKSRATEDVEGDAELTAPAPRTTRNSADDIGPRRGPSYLRYQTSTYTEYPGVRRPGEVIMNHTRVLVMSRHQAIKYVKDNPRIISVRKINVGYDPFTEASASCPIAEESFDSGLLKLHTPWFMDGPM